MCTCTCTHVYSVDQFSYCTCICTCVEKAVLFMSIVEIVRTHSVHEVCKVCIVICSYSRLKSPATGPIHCTRQPFSHATCSSLSHTSTSPPHKFSPGPPPTAQYDRGPPAPCAQSAAHASGQSLQLSSLILFLYVLVQTTVSQVLVEMYWVAVMSCTMHVCEHVYIHFCAVFQPQCICSIV